MAKVSVVMSVHNGLPFLNEAVRSILNQTLHDLELIVIDDGSTDGSSMMLERVEDSRIRILRNEQQQGLSASLNRGAAAASGDYIARMDADDVSQPGRLAAQVTYLDDHPTISVVGTWARTIGDGGKQTWRYPTEDSSIRCALLFHSVLVHSAVMWRRADFERCNLRYDEDIDRAQDYDLWTRAAEHLRFANLASVLQLYRLHAGQVGRREPEGQQAVADSVRARQLADLGVKAGLDELELHNELGRWQLPEGQTGLDRVEAWLIKLDTANESAKRYPKAAFARDLGTRWLFACRRLVPHLGMDAWRRFKESVLSVGAPVSGRAILLVKSLLTEIRGRI